MTLKSRLTGLIAIVTCCLARLSAQAEYHGFNTASGADGMVQEVRWPIPFPVIASFTLLANGSFNLGGTGAVNQAYVLLASSNLVPPVVWAAVATNTADSNGAFTFTELGSTNYRQRFYEILMP